MSVKKINLLKTESVDWTFEIEFGKASIPGMITYCDDYENWLTRTPAAYSDHPTIPALKLKKLSGSRIEGDMIKVTLLYECNDPDAEYPGRPKGKIKRYHMEPGAGEEPLLTNFLFKDFTTAEQEAAGKLLASSKGAADYAEAATALTSAAGTKFIAKVKKGIEAYRSPTLIWVERFTTNNLDDVELTKLLKTTNSPPGDCPSAGGDRNWLRLAPAVSANDDGATWDIENRWELSLPGKWDPDFYPAGG